MKSYFHILLFSAIVLLTSLPGFSQRYTFASGMGSKTHERLGGLITDTEGNYIVSIITADTFYMAHDTVTIKNSFLASIDSAGKINWVHPAGERSSRYTGFVTEPCYPLIRLADPDKIIVVGRYNNTGTIGTTQLADTSIDNVFMAAFTTGGSLLWAKTIGKHFYPYDIAIDKDKNVFVVGSGYVYAYAGNIMLDLESGDAVITKYDSSGNVLWAQRAGGLQGDVAYGVSCDAAGNAYVCGAYPTRMSFGTTLFLEPDSFNQNGYRYDGFLAKYSPDGIPLWAKTCGYGVNGVAADSAGNCYVGGHVNGYGFFGSAYCPYFGGGTAMFIARFNSSGNFNWVLLDTLGPSSGFSQTASLETDKYGNCYATGIYSKQLLLPGCSLNGLDTAGFSAFLLNIRPDGDIYWGKTTDSTNAYGLYIDINQCKVSWGGTFGKVFDSTATEVLAFDSINLSRHGFLDVYLVSMDTCGEAYITSVGNVTAENERWQLYPNPATGHITVNAVLPVEEICIYNTDGILVAVRKQSAGNQIDISNLANGIYIAEIKTREQTQRVKWVKM